jgi:hypothetical protein
LVARVGKSKPQSDLSAKPTGDPAPASPVLLAASQSRRRFQSRSLWLLVGTLIALIAAVGFMAWLWQIKGRSALAASSGVVVPDPDPPVIPPPDQDLLKPDADDFVAPMSLAKSLEMLANSAANVQDPDDQLRVNPRVERWEIRFPDGNTPESYARQLDSLGIELGVVGGSEKIQYASSFAKDKPNRREGPAAEEQRFYMTWRSGALRNLDAALLSRAEIPTTGRIVAQFYPAALERTLVELENQFAGKHELAEVRHTVFALTPLDKDYEFRVVEQEYVSGDVKSADAKPAGTK